MAATLLMAAVSFLTSYCTSAQTVENFTKLASRRYYDGTIIHRIIPGATALEFGICTRPSCQRCHHIVANFRWPTHVCAWPTGFMVQVRACRCWLQNLPMSASVMPLSGSEASAWKIRSLCLEESRLFLNLKVHSYSQAGDPTGTGRGGESTWGGGLFSSLPRILGGDLEPEVLTRQISHPATANTMYPLSCRLYAAGKFEDEITPELKHTGAGILSMVSRLVSDHDPSKCASIYRSEPGTLG